MKIHSIFSSINGEVSKLHQGSLCTFIRLAGCNLQCSYCFGVVPGRHIPKIILSNKKNKKIFDVKIGDKLLTFNSKKELVETEVVNVITREVDSWLKIRIENHDYYVTEEHPFFTTKGLKQAKELQIGDEIFHSNFNDKLSFRMLGNKNPMNDEDIKKKSVKNTNYSLSGRKISSTIERKKKEGTYKPSWDSLTEKRKNEFRKHLSLLRLGDKNPNWKGGSKTPNYDKLKQQIKEGLIKKCPACGEERPLDVHHEDQNRKNDSPTNLKIRCESCHYSIHLIGFNFWKNDNRKDGKHLSAINGFVIEAIKKINRNDFPPSVRPKSLKVYNLTCAPYNSYLIDYMWVHNCDTLYAQSAKEGKKMTLASIVKEVEKLGSSNITITGGEPLVQAKELLKLIDLLKEKQYTVSVETNGSIVIPFVPNVCWVADWKGPSSGMRHKMLLDNFRNLTNNDFLKFVIKDIRDFTDAVNVVREIYNEQRVFNNCPTFAFSPVHKGLKPKTLVKWMLETDICKKTSMVLNLQLHKIIDVS